ncbi:MAG: sugar ABC transporter ATP-binding protein [Eubacteriales bacterium]|nr:sugar ABC transporter ATP-binding protein [Eubacteriales bacterium]
MIDDNDYMVEFKSVSKSFGNTHALRNVSFGVKKGEIHGLLGENGAGKSTLVRILTGTHVRDKGEIIFEGKPYVATSSLDAVNKGISIVFQESNLVPCISVAENMFMGKLTHFNKGGLIKWNDVYAKTKEILSLVHLSNIDPKEPVSKFDLGVRKMIEFAKVLSDKPRLMIMDEITACLTQTYIDIVFDWLRKKKAEGVSVIYISHRVEELFEICDVTTVLRDGEYVTTVDPHGMTETQLSSLTVGRDLEKSFSHYFDRIQASPVGDEEVLSVDGLTMNGVFEDVHLTLHKGEVLSIVGLDGSGSEEVVSSLFGANKDVTGTISVNGEIKEITSPKAAIDSGIGYVPKERERQGIVNIFSINANVTLPILDRLKNGILLNNKKEKGVAQKYVDLLQVKCESIDEQCSQLSGGNKQKVVLGKWLATEAGVMLLNNPTRGVDVGVKSDIYEIIFDLAKSGVSVLLVTGELLEAIKVSHRIITMAFGKVTGEFIQNEKPITEHQLITKMM